MSNFAYVVPQDLEEALILLDQSEQKTWIAAGCTNILPNIKFKKISGGVLVDISGLQELHGITVSGDQFMIGALTTINELIHSKEIAERAPLLCQAGQSFADPSVRSRATIAGNLANASPAADGVIPLLALDTVVTIANLKSGKREVPLEQFFLNPGQTILQKGDLITSLSFTVPEDLKSSFIKLGLRKSMAVSLTSIGLVAESNGTTLEIVRIALGAQGPTPMRAKKTEEFLKGRSLDRETLAKAKEMIRSEVHPIGDVRASKEYRHHLVGVLLERALENVLTQGGANHE